MPLYDFVAPFYDPVLEPAYRLFRGRALGVLPLKAGDVVLDLACGTGGNFALLREKIGPAGKIIGVDVSSGMLRIARARCAARGLENVTLLERDGGALASAELGGAVDAVVCTYALTTMEDWERVFERAWEVLRPGGSFLIHDIYAERRTARVWAIEAVTRCDFSRRTWEPLEKRARDFRFEWIDPSTHLFGGRLFVACGVKG